MQGARHPGRSFASRRKSGQKGKKLISSAQPGNVSSGFTPPCLGDFPLFSGKCLSRCQGSAPVADILVTTPYTPPAGRFGEEPHAGLPAPLPGRPFPAHEVLLRGSVRLVAGPAGHAASLVKMGVVEVPLSHPEGGGAFGKLFPRQLFLVADPAEVVALRAVDGVGFIRVGRHEEKGEVRTMRVMAGGAAACGGGVRERCLCPVRCPQVAGETEVCPPS